MDNKDDKDNNDYGEEECFAKILKMVRATCLPNLVRLPQWEQVSEYIELQTVNLKTVEPGLPSNKH